MYSPVGARRVKTDLQTSELPNIYLQSAQSGTRIGSNVNSKDGSAVSPKTSPRLSATKRKMVIDRMENSTIPVNKSNIDSR